MDKFIFRFLRQFLDSLLLFGKKQIFPIVFFSLLGTASYSQYRTSEAQLTIMAYNIHHANPPSKPGHIDVDAIVEVIRKQNPDLVALQEVDVRTGRSGNIDQAKLIAEKLGMYYFFAKAIDYDGGEYGQAILSRFPISDEQIHRLPSKAAEGVEPRIMATVKVSLEGKSIRFGTVHLDAQRDPADRSLQAVAINSIVSTETLPFVIAGDFNATQSDEALRILSKEWTPTCQDCPFTIPVVTPRKTIDFILFDNKSKWTVDSHQAVDEHYASDHIPIVAILKLED